MSPEYNSSNLYQEVSRKMLSVDCWACAGAKECVALLHLWYPLVYSEENGDETEQSNEDLAGIATGAMYIGSIKQ